MILGDRKANSGSVEVFSNRFAYGVSDTDMYKNVHLCVKASLLDLNEHLRIV